jgi:hypothetical protein
MSDTHLDAHLVDWSPQRRQQLGSQFTSLGRIGFYLQLVLLAIPLMFGVYMMLSGRSASSTTTRFDLGSYVSFASLLIMGFTTFWFYRYMRTGAALQNPQHAPSRSSVVTTVWIGFCAGWLGIVFSVLLLLAATWRMMFVLLTNPQSGLLIAPNLGTNPGYSISAIDAISLTLLVLSLTAELVALGLSLWLLIKLTWPASAEMAEDATFSPA